MSYRPAARCRPCLSFKAAASRSRIDPSRSFCPVALASANMPVTTTSNRSSTSSWALASSVRTNASRVANAPIIGQPRDGLRFGGVGEAGKCGDAAWRKRSSDGRPAAMLCTSSSRSTARPNSAGLCRTGPSRRRSSGLIRSASGTTSNCSSRARCSGVTCIVSRCHNRSLARERTRATARSSTVSPGNKTLLARSQAIARSNRTLGRSVPVQHSA